MSVLVDSRAARSGLVQSIDTIAERLSIVRVIGWLLLSAGIVCAIAVAISPWVVAPERTRLVPASITSSRGAAYLVQLPRDDGKIMRASRDVSVLIPAPMQLLENDQSIGRPSSSIDEVVNRGEGRFAYVHPVLAFSTTDGSDPRTNGRIYAIERPIKARLAVRAFAGLAIVIGLGLAFLNWTRATIISLLRFEWQSTIPSRTGRAVGLSAARYLAFVLATLIAVAQLLWMWWGSASAHLGVAGFLPVSDALGYYGCALSIAAGDAANAPAGVSDWCARRMLYPSVLSSVLGLTGWRPSIALALQALTIGLSAGVLLLALQRTFGWITAVLTTLAVLAFAHEFAIGNFMTEALGLPAGLVGLALLLLAVRNHKPAAAVIVFGLALVSFGTAIRPGALFALPLLGLWLLIVTRSMSTRPRVALMIAGAAAIVLGPALHYAMIIALGADPSNSGGNFATSLYGLSTGSRDWSQAYRDFADVFSKQPETVAFQIVQKAALEKIANDPYTFVSSLVAAGKAFSQSLFAFGPLTPHNTLATWLFCFGLLLCTVHFRRPACLLLLALCMGEFISAPLVYDSGHHRVFTITVAARIVVLAYAFAWIAGLLVREQGGDAVSIAADHRVPVGGRSLAAGSAIIGVVLLVLVILPATPLSHLWRLTPLTSSKGACPADQWEVIAQPGRESMRMAFGDRSLPLGDEQLGSLPGRLELDPTFQRAWWASELPPQLRGAELVYAVQRTRENIGVVVAAFSRTPLPIANDRPISLCLARRQSTDIKLGDHSLHEIVGVAQQQ